MNRDELRAEQLLQSVRRAVQPTHADASRNFSGVEARLGVALGGTPQVPSLAPHGPAAATWGERVAGGLGQGLPLAAKGGLLLVFGLATGVTGYFIGHADAEREPSALVAAQPALPRVIASQTPALVPVRKEVPVERAQPPPPQPESSPRVGVRLATSAAREHGANRARVQAPLQRAAVPVAAASERDLELREAIELLGRAEAAVRRSDGLEARMWLSDLDRRAARDVLLEERLVAATLASCALADVAAAQHSVQELQRANPASMYRARLEGSCVADFVAGGESKVGSPAH